MKSIGFLSCVSSAQKRLLPASLFRNLGLMLACLLLLVSRETNAYAQTASFSYAIQTLGSFGSPWGVAVDGSGNVFVADSANNVVKKIPYSDGSYGTPVTLATGFDAPTGVAVDERGNVFVADSGNYVVKEIPYSGGSYGTPVILATGFNGRTSLAVDGIGNVFVADIGTNLVKEIPCIGGSYSGATVTLASGFSSPSGVAVDGNGNVFVADTGNNVVQEIPYIGGSYGTPVMLLSNLFLSPRGVAVDAKGNLFVADLTANVVQEMPYSGGSYGTAVTLSNGFNLPFGIAVDGKGNVFFTDLNSNVVNKVMTQAVVMPGTAVGQSSSQTLNFTFSSRGAIGPPVVLTMGAPNLDFTDAGTGTCTTNGTSHTYYAGDACTVVVSFTPQSPGPRQGAVELLDSSGNVLATAFVQGTGNGAQVTFPPGQTPVTLGSGFNLLGSVAVDGAGNVYVADYGNNAVKKIPYSGGSYGTPVTLDSGFSFPQGVAVDGGGNVYVADYAHSAVKEIPYSGGGYGTPVTLASGFDQPQGVAVDGAGNVYVGDTGNIAVKKINLADAPSLTFASTIVGATSATQTVTVANTGNQALMLPIPASGFNPSISTGFTWNSSASEACPQISSSASSAGTLAAGSNCALSISFTPTTAGTISGALTLKDDALNASYATQSISLSGTAISSLTATQQISAAFLTKSFTITPFIPVTGSGGTGTLTYSISPALPSGLNLNASTGAVGGTPTVTSTATTYTVTVTDANGATASKTFALTVNGPVSATTVIASVGLTIQNPVSAGIIPVTGSGGVGTLHYTVSPTLPPGITMNSTTGALSGLPTNATPVATYTVTVTDANNATATATFTLAVNPSVSATTAIASVALTQNHAAIAFTPVTGASGTTPLSYSVLPVLPAGLSMASSTGAVSGTPTAVSSATSYTVTVTDANGTTASRNFSLTVNPAVVAGQSVALATLTYGTAATAFTPVTGSGGTGALTYSASPALPAGLSISTAGVVSGTPSAAQSAASYTVTVTDINGSTASNTFTLAVNKATPTITTAPAAGAITYSQTLASSTLTGGVAMFNGNPVVGSFSWTAPTTSPGAGSPSESITFTPTDTANYSTVTGTVAVTVNKAAVTITWPVPSNIVYGTALSVTQLNATASVAGSFTYTLTAGTILAVGGHTLSVSFTPSDTSNYATPVASAVNLTVTAAPLMVAVDSASRIYGAANPTLTGIPKGLVNGDTAASVGLAYSTTATQSSAMGTYSITASITSPNYTLSVTQGTLTVTGATLTVTADNATKIYGTVNPIFNGSVTGQQNGDTFTASYSTTATTNSPVGPYAIVPTVAGSNLSDYTVKQTNGILTITQAASRVALASSATGITPGQSVTLTATAADATPGSTGTPTGTITFLNGSMVLGTATLTNGVASFTTSALAPGTTCALSASYSGDTNFAGSTASSGVSITVASLDFTITLPTNLNPTVMPGGTVQTSFSITSLYGAFAGPVSFTATGLPTGGTISFSPSSIPANSSGTQTITITIKLPATTAQNQQRRSGDSVPPMALGLLLLPLAGMRRVRKSQLLRITLLLLLSGAGIGALTGCGTGNGFNANASQNYTVTVTATAGSLTHNFQIHLNVQ